MAAKPTGVDIVAAREHTTTSRRTRAHVIICHSLNAKSRTLIDLFSLADHVSPEIRTAVARELAGDILADVAVLRGELDGIELFARGQLARLDQD
jgi:hypothetical protein